MKRYNVSFVRKPVKVLLHSKLIYIWNVIVMKYQKVKFYQVPICKRSGKYFLKFWEKRLDQNEIILLDIKISTNNITCDILIY